jgi:imidazolonepropionase-like amidohydrolase/Tol biopolymer transport system component
MKKTSLLFLCNLLILNVFAQKKDDKKWDVANPTGQFNLKDVNFKTDEGTWMNLDVSPDGKTIVFDMLGDIYKLPIVGGKAEILRGGLPFEVQPRFSPDGKKILFTSDAGGGDNIWTMNTDGSNPQQVTKEDFRLLNNAVWLGNDYIIARKHFTSQRSLGAGELWQFHISGGAGIQLTEKKNDQQDLNEPSVSPDGRYVYYSEDTYPGGFFQYNKNPMAQIFAVKRYDRQEGKIEEVIGGTGGAARPQISRDGKKLAFVRRNGVKTVLYIHDLTTGESFPIYQDLSKDQQEAWTIFGIYTGFNWMPDDKNIVIWSKGKIQKLDVVTGKATPIPFTVDVNTKLAETLQFENKVFENQFTAKVIRNCITSPDERFVIFNAVGYLWKKDMPNGTPKRLTSDTDFEAEPTFSPDGKSIVYVSWNDEAMGSLKKMELLTNKTTKLTTEKGIYRTPQYSPDGKMICYRKEGGNEHQGYTYSKNAGLYTISSDGGVSNFVTAKGENPRFSNDSKRIFFNTGGYLFGSLSKEMRSCKLDGTDDKAHFTSKYASQFTVSPDNQWVAFSELYKVYIAPFSKTGKPIGLSSDTKAIPVALVGRDAGINLHWSTDSKKLHWTLGDTYYTDALTKRFKFLEGAKDSLPPVDTMGVKINLVVPTHTPTEKVAFKNARIITMEGDSNVIENGVLIVENNKITAIGDAKSVVIPSGIRVMDLAGKTIMPGIIDVHAHIGEFRLGLSAKQKWEYFTNLAYGITTAHDPSTNSEMVFANAELVKSGTSIGPRVYSTGTILYGAEGDFKAVVNSLDDARSAIRRTAAYGAFSVKSYNQPRREQRQQIIQAAREQKVIVVPEGGSFFFHNLSQIADGHTGVEHNIPVAPLYNDVIQFWKNSKAHNTPTLIVNYAGVNGEFYWYQNTNVYEKKRLLAFTPRSIIDNRARHRTMIPDEEYKNGHILTAESCKNLQKAGVNINLGAHGQLQGLGAHWELWMFVQGGMSNLQALKCATINGAKYLGMDKEIGSLKVGKLADLIILDKNPLENIQNSESVRYTMINGRLFDCETMNEIKGSGEIKRQKFYFELNGNANFPIEAATCAGDKCACRQ